MAAQGPLARINPDAVRNITALNELIPIVLPRRVGGPDTEDERTTPSGSGTIGDIFTEQCGGAGGAGGTPLGCDWQIMESDGNGNDCLIHSFLTVTCPNFRRLELDDKRAFARSFRVELIPKYPEAAAHFAKVDEFGLTGEQRFTEKNPRTRDLRFLGDEDVEFLKELFRVNVILFQGRRVVGRGKHRIDNPASVSELLGNPANPNTYYIYNNGINHFEGVKPNDTYHTDTKAARDNIRNTFSAYKEKGEGPKGEYKFGNSITHDGKKYVVVDRRFGNIGTGTPAIVEVKAVPEEAYRELEGVFGDAIENAFSGAYTGPKPITIDILPKNTKHVRASAAAMAAGPGPEHRVPGSPSDVDIVKAIFNLKTSGEVEGILKYCKVDTLIDLLTKPKPKKRGQTSMHASMLKFLKERLVLSEDYREFVETQIDELLESNAKLAIEGEKDSSKYKTLYQLKDELVDIYGLEARPTKGGARQTRRRAAIRRTRRANRKA
jgi:hypothetical protein